MGEMPCCSSLQTRIDVSPDPNRNTQQQFMHRARMTEMYQYKVSDLWLGSHQCNSTQQLTPAPDVRFAACC